MWISTHDASDPEAGVHCELITDVRAARFAWTGLRLLLRVFELVRVPP